MECYLYYSFYQDEIDANIKLIFESHLEQEISHLHKAAQLLEQYEDKQWQQIIPGGEFPKLLFFHDTKNYVRDVLASYIQLTANRENYTDVSQLPADHTYYFYQGRVNNDVNTVASHTIITEHQQKFNVDYRAEQNSNPVEALTDRTTDNTDVARKALHMAY